MSDLITRLEEATEPDRELDRAIAKALGVMPLYKMRGQIRSSWPDYTASIDAALTLVPEGAWWWIEGQPLNQGKYYEYYAGCVDERTWTGPTPALAICIAALRARGEP